MVFVILCMTCFTLYNTLWVRSCCHKWIPFSCVAEYACTTVSLPGPLSMDTQAVCHVLAIVNNAAMNTGMQTAFQSSGFVFF